MTYIESIKVLNEIEYKYNVMNVKCKQVSVWPFLRIYLFQSLQKSPNRHSMSVSNILTVIKGLFAYNPFVFFLKYDIWLFNACERRKKIGDKYIHRISGCVSLIKPNTLTIEKNGIQNPHYSKKNIEEKKIVSESWFLLMAHAMERILRISTLEIEGREIIEKILIDYEIEFDYEYFIRYLISQKKIVDYFLSITYKPKQVIIECPYNLMGYVWSFKSHGIPVIEFQHGVLNKNHYAYNSNYLSVELYPDKICVYGSYEYEYFIKSGLNYCKNVYKTGLYMLERSDCFFVRDVFSELRQYYQSVIVIAGQAMFEEQMITFIKDVAARNSHLLFVYIPRYPFMINPFDTGNIVYVPNANIYEYLKWSDIHCTISSTTCLEAQYFHKPTIFYNYDNLSIEYYSDKLGLNNGVIYINKVNEFISAYQQILNGKFEYCNIFESNCMAKMCQVIK